MKSFNPTSPNSPKKFWNIHPFPRPKVKLFFTTRPILSRDILGQPHHGQSKFLFPPAGGPMVFNNFGGFKKGLVKGDKVEEGKVGGAFLHVA